MSGSRQMLSTFETWWHTGRNQIWFFQRNGRVHLNRRGASVQSTTGSRGVRISGSNGSNAGYSMFWGRVLDYWLPTPLVCFPFTSTTVRHRVPSGFNWALQNTNICCGYLLLTRIALTVMRVTSLIVIGGGGTIIDLRWGLRCFFNATLANQIFCHHWGLGDSYVIP
jgi:hypothetical protein